MSVCHSHSHHSQHWHLGNFGISGCHVSSHTECDMRVRACTWLLVWMWWLAAWAVFGRAPQLELPLPATNCSELTMGEAAGMDCVGIFGNSVYKLRTAN